MAGFETDIPNAEPTPRLLRGGVASPPAGLEGEAWRSDEEDAFGLDGDWGSLLAGEPNSADGGFEVALVGRISRSAPSLMCFFAKDIIGRFGLSSSPGEVGHSSSSSNALSSAPSSTLLGLRAFRGERAGIGSAKIPVVGGGSLERVTRLGFTDSAPIDVDMSSSVSCGGWCLELVFSAAVKLTISGLQGTAFSLSSDGGLAKATFLT